MIKCAACRQERDTIHVDEPYGAIRLCAECDDREAIRQIRTVPVSLLSVLVGASLVGATLLLLGRLG